LRKTSVLVTRPEPGAGAFARLLEQRGFTPVLCPLTEINYRDAPVDLAGVGALAVTSANGVRALAARMERRDIPAFAVGEATAQAARAAGFETVHAAAGDVDALAATIEKAHGAGVINGAVLHICGAHQAGDLAGLLMRAGIEARRSVHYKAVAAASLPPPIVEMLHTEPPEWAAFFSPRAAAAFTALVNAADLSGALSLMNAACLSAAVANRLNGARWGSVRVAAAPAMAAIADLIGQPNSGNGP